MGAVQDIIKSEGLVFYSVSKSEVEARTHKQALKILARLEPYGKAARGRLAILFEGYDDCPDEIFEITAIRKWVSELLQKAPHSVYFLTPYENNLQTIIACASDVRIYRSFAESQVGLAITVPGELRSLFRKSLAPFTLAIGDPEYVTYLDDLICGKAKGGW